MLGNRLKSLREELNLKQEELANRLSVSASAIGMYERGSREPNNELTLRFANFFEVSTDYLLGKSNIRNAEKELQKASNNSEILSYYNQLNNLGKEKAINNVEDLTKIPEYTQKRDKSQNA